MGFDPANDPHRRLNLLTGSWVLVSPHRAKRPWQGTEDRIVVPAGQSHDPACFLCPGNARSNGAVNPDYRGPFVFDNDFPALLADAPEPTSFGQGHLFRLQGVSGTARVICYSPDHSATIADMEMAQARQLVDCWAEQTAQLGKRYACVQIFENKGEMMGCSSPHPHGQVWASDFVPDVVAQEDRQQAGWHDAFGKVLLDEVACQEITLETRVVECNDHWVVIVPWWAVWPFETLLIARDRVGTLEALSDNARDALAAILGNLNRRYDALFGVSFPYSMGWHQCPPGSRNPAAWRLHAHFNPPLLRSARVRKFMVGYEMFAESQRDLTPEIAALRLRMVQP